MSRSVCPSPKDIARRLPRNSGRRGDTIRYRNGLGLIETMLVEDVTGAADEINVIYMGAGKRLVNSRQVLEVIK